MMQFLPVFQSVNANKKSIGSSLIALRVIPPILLRRPFAYAAAINRCNGQTIHKLFVYFGKLIGNWVIRSYNFWECLPYYHLWKQANFQIPSFVFLNSLSAKNLFILCS